MPRGLRGSLGNGRAKYGPGPTVLFGSLSWAEALLGEYGAVDKALVYNVMKILGLPPSLPPDCSHSFKCNHTSKQLTPSSPRSWAGDFFRLHVTLILCCLYFLLPPFLPCRELALYILLSYSSHRLFSGLAWHIPPPPVYFNADCSVLRSTGSATWLSHHGLSPPHPHPQPHSIKELCFRFFFRH